MGNRPKPKYTFAELLDQCDFSIPRSAEEQELLDAPDVGKEIIMDDKMIDKGIDNLRERCREQGEDWADFERQIREATAEDEKQKHALLARIDALEHKAAMRKIWTDMWNKALPPILFMAGSSIIMFSAPDWTTRIAAAMFMCGAWLMIML